MLWILRRQALWVCLPFLAAVSSLRAQRAVRESAAQYAAARRLTLTATQRWCADPDAAGCDFAGITDAVLTDDGGVIAANYGGPIRRFSVSGALVQELGRRGAGPGEYRYVHDPMLAADGMLTWYDVALRRLTSINTRANTAGPVTTLQADVSASGMYVTALGLVTLEVPPGRRPGDTVSAAVRTVPASGAPRVLATVRRPSWFAPGSPVSLLPPLFSPNTVADVSSAGDVAHGMGGRYELEVVPARGDRWTLTVAIPPRPVTAADREAAVAQELKDSRVRTVGELDAAMQERLRAASPTFPMLDAVKVLRDGTVWVRPTPAAGARTARWDVFTIAGVRVGQAVLPLDAMVTDGTAAWIVAVEPGPDDVPVVVRYTVR